MTDEEIGLTWEFRQFANEDGSDKHYWSAIVKYDEKKNTELGMKVDIKYNILENGEWTVTPMMKDVDLPLLIHHLGNVYQQILQFKREQNQK